MLWRFSSSSAISLRFFVVDNACDRGAKHWLLLYQHNGRWVWGTIFFMWWYWFCKGQSAYQSNQPHPPDWLYWETISGQLILTFFLCAKSYLLTVLVYSTSAKLDPTTFVVKPSQQMWPSIVVHPIVKRTTTTCFYIFLHISGHPPRRFERKVAIDKISMVLRSDRSGNVEKQLSVNSRNFWFLGNSSTSLRTTTDTPRFSRPALACPV